MADPLSGLDFERLSRNLPIPVKPPALVSSSNLPPPPGGASAYYPISQPNPVAPPPPITFGPAPTGQDILKTGLGTLGALRDLTTTAWIKKQNRGVLDTNEASLIKNFDPVSYAASVLEGARSGSGFSQSDAALIARILADKPDSGKDISYVMQHVNSTLPFDVNPIRMALGLAPGAPPLLPTPTTPTTPVVTPPPAPTLPPPVASSPVQQEVRQALPPALNDLANFSPPPVGSFTYQSSGAPQRIAQGQFDTGAADITRSINAERKLGYADLAARGIRGGGLAELQNELAGKEAGAIGGLRIKSADTLNALQQQERGQQFNEFAQQKAIALDSYQKQVQAKSNLVNNYLSIAQSDAQIQQGDFKNFLDALDTSYKSYLAQRSLDYERRAANGELTQEEAQIGLQSEVLSLQKQRNDFAQALLPEALNALDKTARAQKVSAVASGISGALSLGMSGAAIGFLAGGPVGAGIGGGAGLLIGGGTALASALS